ncbi:uncharacterized protein [Apostichopus japonicus]
MESFVNDEDESGNTDEEEGERKEAEENFYQQIYYQTYHSSLGITGHTKETTKVNEISLDKSYNSTHQEDQSKQQDQRGKQKKKGSESLNLKLGRNSDYIKSGNVRQDDLYGGEKPKIRPNGIDVRNFKNVSQEHCNAKNSAEVVRNGKKNQKSKDFVSSSSEMGKKGRLHNSQFSSTREKKLPSLGKLMKGCFFSSKRSNGFHSDDEDESSVELCGSEGSVYDEVWTVSSDTDEDQYCELVDSSLDDIWEMINEDPGIEDPKNEERAKEAKSIQQPSAVKGHKKSSLGKNRYFSATDDTKCTNCFSFGHVKDVCPEAERPAMCVLCGVRGHISYDCPDRLCFNCDRPGHQSRDCFYPPQKPYHQCLRCKMFGHRQEMCPDQWRQYHMTTEIDELVTAEITDLKLTKMKKYCYNCGVKGHLGHMCKESRMPLPKGEKITLCTMPIVCQYKKLRYPKDGTTGSERRDKINQENGGFKRDGVYVVSSTESSSEEDLNRGRQKKRKFDYNQQLDSFNLPSFYQNKNKNPNFAQKLRRGQNMSVFHRLGDTSVEHCQGKSQISDLLVAGSHGNHRRKGRIKRGKKTYFNDSAENERKTTTGHFKLLMAGFKKKGKVKKKYGKIRSGDDYRKEGNMGWYGDDLYPSLPPNMSAINGVAGNQSDTKNKNLRNNAKKKNKKRNSKYLQRLNKTAEKNGSNFLKGKKNDISINFNSNGQRQVYLD